MNNLSYVSQGNQVRFPKFSGDRVYMLAFNKDEGLPKNLSKWQKTVDDMLTGLDIPNDNIMYLMIDERFVRAGEMHRRPGVHIDGYWIPAIAGHGHIHNNVTYGCHSHNGGYVTNQIPTGGHSHSGGHMIPEIPNGNHVTNSHYHGNTNSASINKPTKKRMNGKEYIEWAPEALILASNVSAATAWNGIYEGEPNVGGDCSHIDTSSLEKINMMENTAYIGNVTMLHESLPVSHDCYRSLIRLNVPGWSPKLH